MSALAATHSASAPRRLGALTGAAVGAIGAALFLSLGVPALVAAIPIGSALGALFAPFVGMDRGLGLRKTLAMAALAVVIGAVAVAAGLLGDGWSTVDPATSVVGVVGTTIGLALVGTLIFGLPALVVTLPSVGIWVLLTRSALRSPEPGAHAANIAARVGGLGAWLWLVGSGRVDVVAALFLPAPLVLVPLALESAVAAGSRHLVARSASLAGLGLGIAFAVDRGLLAAALAIPWLLVAIGAALLTTPSAIRSLTRRRPIHELGPALGSGFLVVGATFACISRLGFRPFDLPSAIVLLTAVHFHYAGFLLPVATSLAGRHGRGRLADLAIALLSAGIPTTALGFLSTPTVAWAGAVLVGAGGIASGLAQLLVAPSLGRASGLAVAAGGTALILAMPIGVTYATATMLGLPFLDIASMARVHGGLNALGFGLVGVVGWWWAERRGDR